jgi:predicted RecB family nuclease
VNKGGSNLVSVKALIFAKIYFPCFSNGLKDVARFLGFEWSHAEASGLQTIQWRKNWQRERDSLLKEKLITYNAEDCEALSRVFECLRSLCDSDSSQQSCYLATSCIL